MVTGAILLLHGVILCAAVPGLWRRKKKKEMFLFIAFMLFSAYAGIAESASLPRPLLFKGVDYVFGPASRWIESKLGGEAG